MSKAT